MLQDHVAGLPIDFPTTMFDACIAQVTGDSFKYISKALGQKSCSPKVPRIFKIFVPNSAPNFAPNFSRIFRGFFVLRFVGNGDQKKFTKNRRHFSMQNSQANTKKLFTKCFWRAGKVIKQCSRFECNSCQPLPHCAALCRTSKRRVRCPPKSPKPSGRPLPLNSIPPSLYNV